MNVIVLVAHPDDEVLGCGGWMAKMSAEGHDLTVLFATDGVRHPPISTDSKEDSYSANAVLGVARENIHYLGVPTQRADGHVLRDYTQLVEQLAGQPDMVIIPSRTDLNVDHLFAHQLGMICFRPVKRRVRIVEMEILSSTEYGEDSFNPNFYVDISGYVEKKTEALSKYSKQVLEFPHPRSPQAVTIKAQQRGLEVGCNSAEAFRIIRWFE